MLFRSVPGGLNVTGVAPYKLRAEGAKAEMDWLLGIGGIDIRLGVEVGKDVSWDALQGYDAVFLGVGLGPDRLLGGELAGVHGAVAWIEKMKLGKVDLGAVREAIVLGGGNTAIDCVRELLGLGVPGVTMVYRRTEADMSGYAHEWEAARKYGAKVVWQAAPVAYVGDGAVRAVRCKTPAGEVDLPADLVLVAIGQAKLGDTLARLGVSVEGGRVVVDASGATSRKGWFAGGDLANGGKEVVNAVAEGKRAAAGIHAFLTGGGHA